MPTIAEAVTSGIEAGNAAAAIPAPAPAPTTPQAPAEQVQTAAPPPAETRPAKVPRFFTQEPQEATKPSFDPTALSPEAKAYIDAREHELTALMTRKTQEAAEVRRGAEERERLLTERERSLKEQAELVRRLALREQGVRDPADAREQIRQLRLEGRHDEADEMFSNLIMAQVQQKTDPYLQKADAATRQASFVSLAVQTIKSDPLVKTYEQDVVAQWDNPNDPIAAKFREFATSSEENMKMFVPTAFNLLAARAHAAALEQRFDERVQEGIRRGLEERRTVAQATPRKLIEFGAVSSESANAKPASASEALRAAIKLGVLEAQRS